LIFLAFRERKHLSSHLFNRHWGEAELCGLETALGAGAKVVGEAILSEAAKEGGKAALKQLLARFDKEKDPVVFFGLFCSFKELPGFDIVSSQLNTILESTSLKSQEFMLGKHTFKYRLVGMNSRVVKYRIALGS
jgi:hypothetical protein